MSHSYSGDPGSSELDEVRFWLADTDPDNWLLSDAEITYLLTTWMPASGSAVFVAAVAAEVVAAKYAGEVSVSADGVSVSVGDLQNRYLTLAARLREQYKSAAATSTAPLVNGIMWDDAYDTSIKPLVFGLGSMDNYEAGRQDYGDYEPGAGLFGGVMGLYAATHPVAAGLLKE